MTEPARPPLSGVRVLEVGVFMAAPFAAMQLADLGAEVIKVEDPRSGDPVRASRPFVDGESSPYLRLNRNEASVALDLKSEAGKAAFLALVQTADVVLENLRPGAMARLGLDAAGVRAVDPRVVHASGSALGAAGVPCAPINDYGQVFTDDHLTARSFSWDAPHPVLPPQRQIGSPMRLSATPAVRSHAGPPLGSDTRAVLTRAGVRADVVDAVCGEPA